MSEFKRVSEVKPGYDCGPGGENCKHEPKGKHGIQCDEWWYGVVKDNRALSLTVFSHIYPESVKRPLPKSLSSGPEGAHMHMHRPQEGGKDCHLIEGSCNAEHLGYIQSEKFFEEHGVPTFEQPESFWLAMEAKFREEIGN